MFFNFMGGEPSPEQIEAAQKAHDREVQHNEMISRDLSRVFKTLDADGLYALRSLVGLAAQVPARGIYYEGVMAGILHVTHGRCLHCSMDHPDDFAHGVESLEKLANGGGPDRETLIEDNVDGTPSLFAQVEDVIDKDAVEAYDVRMLVGDFIFAKGGAYNPPNVLAVISELAGVAPRLPLDSTTQEYAEQWQVDDLWEQNEGEPDKFLGWVCTRCKSQRWPSLQDRMLSPKGIEGCGGCQQKAKWG